MKGAHSTCGYVYAVRNLCPGGLTDLQGTLTAPLPSEEGAI